MQLIPGSRESRAPIVLIAGRRGTSSIAADLEELLRATGRRVRLAANNHRAVCSEQPATLHRVVAQLARRKPRTGVLVKAASPARLGRRGVPVDRCSVAAITDSAPSADSESFRRGVDAVLKATSGFVVIDADNAAAVAATRPLDRARLVLCARRENEAVLQHAALGGPVVVRVDRAGGELIELRSAGTVLASTSVSLLLRSSGRGRFPRRVRTRMFAVALAFGLGVSSQQLAAAGQRRDRGSVLLWHERVAAARGTPALLD